MRTLMKEAFGYAVASAAAFAVDVSILFLLVRYAHWWYLAAATVSFTAGVAVAYVFSVRLVFKYRRIESRHKEFVAFALIGAVGVVLNAALIFVAVDFLGWNYLLGKCLAAGGTFLCNFLLRRRLLFVDTRAATAAEMARPAHE